MPEISSQPTSFPESAALASIVNPALIALQTERLPENFSELLTDPYPLGVVRALQELDLGRNPLRTGPAVRTLSAPYSAYLEWDLSRYRNEDLHTTTTDAEVAIIGGGLAAIVFAKRLSEVGARVTLYESRASLGGVWSDGFKYPGARVDIGSLVYWPASFGKFEFRDIYPSHEEMNAAIRNVAHQTLSKVHVRLNTRVIALRWDSRVRRWQITSQTAGERDSHVRGSNYDWVVLASGKQIEPRDSMFENGTPTGHWTVPSFHDLDLVSGKTVNIVGSAATAIQVAIEIAQQARHVRVIQRSPNWILNVPNLRQSVSIGQRALVRSLVGYEDWLRAYFMMRSIDGNLPRVCVDKAWTKEGSVSEENLKFRFELIDGMMNAFSGTEIDERLIIPEFAPGAKRILLDDGSYPQIFKNGAELVAAADIHPIEGGIATSSGNEYLAEVTLWATGWKSGYPPSGLRITVPGVGDLSGVWKDEPTAMLNVMDWRFPNLFFVWGPYSNVVVHGSNTHMMELQGKLLVEILTEQRARGALTVAPNRQAQETYQDWVHRGNSHRAWGSSAVKSWYKNNEGVVTENFPGSTWDYWMWLEDSKWQGFRFE